MDQEETVTTTDREAPMAPLNKQLAVEAARSALPEAVDPEFVVAERDMAVACFYTPQPGLDDPLIAYDLFSFFAYRIDGGAIAEQWSSAHRYALLLRAPHTAVTRPRADVGAGLSDLEANKQLVADFYERVFVPMDPTAIADFVAEDYRQNSSHMPQGRAGLEALVSDLAQHRPPKPPRNGDAPSGPEPAILVAEGDLVVIAGCLPQRDRRDPRTTWPYYAFDAYRVRDGRLAEHWSGINQAAPPEHR
jgi:predicted SnoaL-like aldol condensation-catalyzing enzyme